MFNSVTWTSLHALKTLLILNENTVDLMFTINYFLSNMTQVSEKGTIQHLTDEVFL